MGIGLFILFGAYELASESIRQLAQEPRVLESPVLLMISTAASVALIGTLAWYKNKVAREENSPSLGADARHSMTDLAAAAAVLVGVALDIAGVQRADSVAALVVVAFLTWAGIMVTLNGIKVLLDASIEKDVLFKAKEIAEAHQGVDKVLDVEGRNSGSYRFLTLTLVPRSRDLEKANHVAEEVRAEISRGIANVDRINIDLKAILKESMLCAIPLDEDGHTVSGHFGEAPFFSLISVKLPGGEVTSRETLINPFTSLDKGKGVRVAEFLAQQGVELILVRESLEGKGARYALEAQDIIEIVRPEALDLEGAEKILVDFVLGR
jgi:cation diffusion facilitator family transporter